MNESGPVDTSIQNALSQVNIQDFPLFKLETLANATNNFSEPNMLGKGGFGPVYKVVSDHFLFIPFDPFSYVSFSLSMKC